MHNVASLINTKIYTKKGVMLL